MKKICYLVAIGFALVCVMTGAATIGKMIANTRNATKGVVHRTITVYTADGKKIANYEGKIDIDTNDGGYVKFDFDGKRYIYYNCFVETIADIN